MNVKKSWNQEVDNMNMAHLTLEPRGRHMHGQGVPSYVLALEMMNY
jgi:hypothetical protein